MSSWQAAGEHRDGEVKQRRNPFIQGESRVALAWSSQLLRVYVYKVAGSANRGGLKSEDRSAGWIGMLMYCIYYGWQIWELVKFE